MWLRNKKAQEISDALQRLDTQITNDLAHIRQDIRWLKSLLVGLFVSVMAGLFVTIVAVAAGAAISYFF